MEHKINKLKIMIVGGAGVGIANMELYFTKDAGLKIFSFGQRKKKKRNNNDNKIMHSECHRPMTPRSHYRTFDMLLSTIA